jgi:hypothetical protein
MVRTSASSGQLTEAGLERLRQLEAIKLAKHGLRFFPAWVADMEVKAQLQTNIRASVLESLGELVGRPGDERSISR